jgi:hypothetical protein
MPSDLRPAQRTVLLGLIVAVAGAAGAPMAAAAAPLHQVTTVARGVAQPVASRGVKADDSSFTCNANASFTGTRGTQVGNAWTIDYTGGWSCTTPMVMSGQTKLKHGTTLKTYAKAPAFAVTAASPASADSVVGVPGGTWTSEFIGSVQAPAGNDWTYVSSGCTGLDTTVMTCDIVASGVLKKSG